MSAIRRTVPLYQLWSLLWTSGYRSHRAPPLTHVDDMPDDLLKDIGLEHRVSGSERFGNARHRRVGLGDYLRPGPL